MAALQGKGICAWEVGTGTTRDENARLGWMEGCARVGYALSALPGSSNLTGGLRMTWWGVECSMGSSFGSLRMSGLEAQEAHSHRNGMTH